MSKKSCFINGSELPSINTQSSAKKSSLCSTDGYLFNRTLFQQIFCNGKEKFGKFFLPIAKYLLKKENTLNMELAAIIRGLLPLKHPIISDYSRYPQSIIFEN